MGIFHFLQPSFSFPYLTHYILFAIFLIQHKQMSRTPTEMRSFQACSVMSIIILMNRGIFLQSLQAGKDLIGESVCFFLYPYLRMPDIPK